MHYNYYWRTAEDNVRHGIGDISKIVNELRHYHGDAFNWNKEISKMCKEEFGVGVLMWEYGEKSR